MEETNKNKNIPAHIGIIIDGNRRWARERNLSSFDGHLKGYELLKYVPEWFYDRGVKVLSIFVFSTENWKRSRDEVNYLMKLAKKVFQDDLEDLFQRGYRLSFSGRIDELPGDLPEVCQQAILKTKHNERGVLNLCFNYGGRAEIVDAVKKIINNKIEPEQIHEGMLRKYLYNSDLSDPDIIVRTSGEQRLSGFQLWQSAYSELIFLKKYWPDFERSDVDLILEEYNTRSRRFGGS